MKCAHCGQFSPIVLLEDAPDGSEGWWCWMCSALYRAESPEEAVAIIIDEARGQMQGAIDTGRVMDLNAAHTSAYVLHWQLRFELWICFCFWLSGMRYAYDFDKHHLAFVPPFKLRYINISVSVDTSTGKVTNLED